MAQTLSKSDIICELLSVAHGAGELISQLQPRTLRVIDKGKGDFATEADLRAEDYILGRLEKSHPSIPVVSEERFSGDKVPGQCFIVDPLDGTKNFRSGCADWTVLISYCENGRPYSGVIIQPALGNEVWAELGRGCHLNGERVRLEPLSSPMLTLQLDLMSHSSEAEKSFLFDLLTEVNLVRALGVAGGSITEILQDRSDAYINFGAKIWDFAAPCVAIGEAGGILTDLNGDEIRWDSVPMRAVAGKKEAVERITRKGRGL